MNPRLETKNNNPSGIFPVFKAIAKNITSRYVNIALTWTKHVKNKLGGFITFLEVNFSLIGDKLLNNFIFSVKRICFPG